MSLKRFTKQELINLKHSLEKGDSPGVQYTLADVCCELQRREPHRFDPREIAKTIIEQSQASPDGLTTYGALWKALTKGEPWKARHSQSVMARELANVIAYCHQNGLPILTTLVVQSAKRVLSDEAVSNICRECLKLGIKIGSDSRNFVEAQAEASRSITVAKLPRSWMPREPRPIARA